MIWSNFATIIWEVLHKKTSFRALRKWKMNFPCKENKNSLRKHCLEFQYAPLCTTWDHLNKLCHECGHKIDHLAWKPCIFTHDSSFLEHFLKIFPYYKFIIFPGNLVTYNDTMRRFSNFLFFLNFLCPFQNAVKTAGMTVPSWLLNLGIFLMFLWLNRYLWT